MQSSTIYTKYSKGLKCQPDTLNEQYEYKSKEYMKGVARVNRLLFSWKSWQWYRSHIPMTGYDQAGLDGAVTYVSHARIVSLRYHFLIR